MEDTNFIFRQHGENIRSREEWISVSVIGDPWEVELEIHSDRYRYRSAMFGRIRTEWAYGRPPTGFHSGK
jgi:hypothetical protein